MFILSIGNALENFQFSFPIPISAVTTYNLVQALSSEYGMRASNCEQSVKIGGEGYFDVTNAIGRGARAANDRSAVNATYLQHNSRKCCIL